MSTDATSVNKPVSSVGNTVTPTSAPAIDKGKGKVEKVEEGEDEDDEDDEDEDNEMDEDDDEDDDEEDEFEEIDPTAIVGRRTRGARVDYTSTEALRKAGLKPEEDAEEEGEDSFVHDDNAMKH